MKKIIILIMALMIGLSSAFAIDLIEGRKVELSELDFNTVVSYPYKITNKSDNDVSILMIKKEIKTGEILEVYEYVIPANSTVNFVFTNECKTNKEFWGFGWVNNNSSISNGGADWWSRQGNIIINKDGYLTYLENNVRKNMCQIKKLSHNYLMD